MQTTTCPAGHVITIPAAHRHCFLAADRANLIELRKRDPLVAKALERSIARREARP